MEYSLVIIGPYERAIVSDGQHKARAFLMGDDQSWLITTLSLGYLHEVRCEGDIVDAFLDHQDATQGMDIPLSDFQLPGTTE